METSFANGGQLSASNAEVWNSWGTVLKGLKWMMSPKEQPPRKLSGKQTAPKRDSEKWSSSSRRWCNRRSDDRPRGMLSGQ
jgi:hypothetical protein